MARPSIRTTNDILDEIRVTFPVGQNGLPTDSVGAWESDDGAVVWLTSAAEIDADGRPVVGQHIPGAVGGATLDEALEALLKKLRKG